MKHKYILIHGAKQEARTAFYNGSFFTWTAENLKSAFAFGNGTIKDFRRFAKDNAGNTTAIDAETLLYIDTGKPCNISRTDIDAVYLKYNIA